MRVAIQLCRLIRLGQRIRLVPACLRGGLWNPFTREDRDAIQRQARAQLMAAGGELALLRHANESAVELLRLLLAKDGYTVDVGIRGA